LHTRRRPQLYPTLAPEDRCHLNGLALVDGRPQYVTALGETDTAGGWRANKASGGLLMDIESNQTLLRGLSMPHSPRWYNNQFYVLESGQGNLAAVDLEASCTSRAPRFLRSAGFHRPVAGARDGYF
jgi:uncharacterized protein (TIGR03032 family)